MATKKFNYQALILVILAIVAGMIFFALQKKKSFQHAPGAPMLQVGRTAPNFRLPGLDGKTVSLSDYRGNVVLVNIWATWCRPCVAEMPSMEKLYQELKGEAFEILAVSIDTEGGGVVVPFMRKHGLTFPALIDPQGTTKTAYNLTGVPESFIIDKKGGLAKKIIGPLDWASPEVLDYFRSLIHPPEE